MDKNKSRRGKSHSKNPKEGVRRENRRDSSTGKECVNPSGTRNDRISGLNDLSWYSRYPEILAAAGMLPFPYKPGMSINFGTNANYNIPGVCRLQWSPTLGNSAVATDPASIVAKEIYSKVRSKFSGSLDADAPDFVIYLMALDSIYSYIGNLKRLYRILNAYTPYNYALPDVLLQALGCGDATIQNLRQDKTKLWGIINELIRMTDKFQCPAIMPIFNRHYWLNDNVYTDADTIQSQLYVFRQLYYYKYAPLNTPDDVPAAGLTYDSTPFFTTEALTVDEIFQFGRSLIDTLSAWDESYTISGYLLRAYEGVPTFTVAILEQDEQFTPVYVPEVLTQIENARMLPYGDLVTAVNGNVTQDPKTNAIISAPTFTITPGAGLYQTVADVAAWKPMLSLRSNNPTVADIVIATRLLCTAKDIRKVGETAVYSVNCGTEILLNIGLFKYGADGKTVQAMYYRQDTILRYDDPTSEVPPAITASHDITQYDWHPIGRTLYQVGDDVGASYFFALVGDTHNITDVSTDALANLHKVCVYSEFNAFT